MQLEPDFNIIECAICGESFKATNDRAKFCSNACRQKNYRVNENLKIKKDKATIKALKRTIKINELKDQSESS